MKLSFVYYQLKCNNIINLLFILKFDKMIIVL